MEEFWIFALVNLLICNVKYLLWYYWPIRVVATKLRQQTLQINWQEITGTAYCSLNLCRDDKQNVLS